MLKVSVVVATVASLIYTVLNVYAVASTAASLQAARMFAQRHLGSTAVKRSTDKIAADLYKHWAKSQGYGTEFAAELRTLRNVYDPLARTIKNKRYSDQYMKIGDYL